MRVLVGCERSGVVRRAFAALGHEAYSTDLAPADDGETKYHIQGDLLQILDDGWDLMIAHPPCTYLSVSGMHWTARGLRDPQLTLDALDFVRMLMAANIPKICIENPVGVISTTIRKADQWIQPYEFGDDASKKTGLWLKGLAKLKPTCFVQPRLVCTCANVYRYVGFSCPRCGTPASKAKKRWANQTDSGQNRLGPSPERAKMRSQTYEGIAKAMASQWSEVGYPVNTTGE